MIKHIVMWKLKDEAEGRDKAANARIMKEKLESLVDLIPELRTAEVGINIEESDAAFDVVLISEFESKEDLQAYMGHPRHKEAGKFVAAVRSDRKVVDYII